MIYEQLKLIVTRGTYTFTPLYEPANGSSDFVDQSLTVYRDNGALQLNAPPSNKPDPVLQELVVYGIVGFIQLQAGEYMIVVTGRSRVGSLCGSDIYRATTFQILPLPYDVPDMTDQQLKDEQTFIHLLECHLKQNTFYFSYSFHLTLSIQRQMDLPLTVEPLWKLADQRFFWNRYLAEKLIDITESGFLDLSPFILPLMQGFVAIIPTAVNRAEIVFSIISRRSRERAGTRYFSRGLDEHGHASNFVETEQIVVVLVSNDQKQVFAHVQTRGSVPAVWGQIVNTRYTPALWVESDLKASRAHFSEQIRRYGPQILVNLVNKKGYEYPVCETYARTVDALADPRLTYVHFDFHHECRKMRWNRVQSLIEQLEPELLKQGYFFCDTGKSRRHQTSVVRTNCMDCLDRTNVVQSTLARWVLNRQLREAGILDIAASVEDDQGFMRIFNHAWADNADALSIAYSGTGALKTDYTRTGKRTYVGAWHDFVNSIVRYTMNNFMDGSRQDGIDLFLGNYVVGGSPLFISPFAAMPPKPWAIPAVFVLSFFCFLVGLFVPDVFGLSDGDTLYIVVLSFFFASAVYTWRLIQEYGTQLVDKPALVVVPRPTKSLDSTPSSTPSSRRRSAMLDDAEQGHESSTIKKTT